MSLPNFNMYSPAKNPALQGDHLVTSDGTTIDFARNTKEVLLKKLLPYKE